MTTNTGRAPTHDAAPRFTYAGTELDALAAATRYYCAILDRFAPHLGRRVVEVGAGIGTFAAVLRRGADLDSLTLIEPAANNLPLLRERFAADPAVRVVAGYLEEHVATLAADSIVAVNVLEHVADDAAFLRAARAALAPGGALLIFVPALAPLHGTLDDAFGHVRRYSRASLTAALHEAGLTPESVRYFNLPGVVTWFLAGRVFRRRTIGPRQVRFYDRWVIPWVARLERRWSPPIGQSLVAVARKDPA